MYPNIWKNFKIKILRWFLYLYQFSSLIFCLKINPNLATFFQQENSKWVFSSILKFEFFWTLVNHRKWFFVQINAARSPKVKIFCYVLLDSKIFELEILKKRHSSSSFRDYKVFLKKVSKSSFGFCLKPFKRENAIWPTNFHDQVGELVHYNKRLRVYQTCFHQFELDLRGLYFIKFKIQKTKKL